jgi:hypothetical protein
MASPSIIPTLRVNQVSAAIVNSAMKVHSILGPGLLESAYDACLSHELRKRGFHVDTQVGLPVVYEGEKLDLGYRIDLLVEPGHRRDQVRRGHPSRPRSPAAFVFTAQQEERRPVD